MGDGDIITSFGGPGLMAIAFIAATIFPLSSEAAVFGALKLGMTPGEVLFWASLGNCLGVVLNYILGRWWRESILRKTMQTRTGRRAIAWSERYGRWSLLLSWLPLIGDPLTLVAGILRVHPLFFAVVAFSVRILRYAVLIALL